MRFIQTGAGQMGKAWIRTVQATPGVEYVALVDIDVAAAQACAAEFGLDPACVFPTLEAALATVSADGVIDVTPPAAHLAVAAAALGAGLPVLAEKPLATSREDAQAIAALSRETGVLYMVAQNYRYSRAAATVKRALQSGSIGPLGAVSIEYYKGPRNVSFRAWMDYPLIVDMSIHHFDMLRYFLGSDPVEVYGQSWNPPWSWFRGDASAAVSARFASGVAASYSASWCSQAQETTWNGDWRFDGEHGVLTLRDDRVYEQRRSPAGELSPLEELPLVELPREAQAYLLDEFVAAAAGGPTPGTVVEDNLRTVGFVFDVVQSFQSGQPVRRA